MAYRFFASLLCLANAARAGSLSASYRKDAFLPYNLYPEAQLPDPSSGGRVHIIGLSSAPCPDTTQASIFIDGVQVDVSDNSTEPPASWSFDWLRVEPVMITSPGEPVWVSFHSRQAVWDSRESAELLVTCGDNAVLNGSFPVVAPTVIVTWVTVANDTSSAPVVVIYVKHVDANATSPQTATMVLLNGIDITSSIPLPALVIPPGLAGVWAVPLSSLPLDATSAGRVWTVSITWSDESVPATAAGGNFWPAVYPVETWPGGKDCPFPGANASNYDVHRTHGINTFFLDHDPNTDGGPGCANGPTGQQVVDSISIENGFWTLVSHGFLKPDQITNFTNVAAWFLADEDDQSIGLQLRQDAANTAALHARTPGIPTYQGGSRNRYTGTFAGSTDIKGQDFYVAACAPHVTEWGSRQLFRGSYDYLRNTRNNQMPGPTWLYAQAFDDSWNSWDGQVRQPDAAEMAVSIMSAVAAGAKGLMMFMTEVRYLNAAPTAATWAAIGALAREVTALVPLYRGGDISGNAVARTNGAVDADVISEATISPQGIVVTLINIANDGGYADLPCGVGAVQHWRVVAHSVDALAVAIPAGLCVVDSFELSNATLVPGPSVPFPANQSSLCGPASLELRGLQLAPTWPGVTRTIVLAASAGLRASVEAALQPWAPGLQSAQTQTYIITTVVSGLGQPFQLGTDNNGGILLGDVGSATVKRVFPNGTSTTLVSGVSGGWGGAMTNGAGGYFFDAGNNRIAVANLSSKVNLTTVRIAAGSLVAGYAGDGGPATLARLNAPHGLGYDGAGGLFIGDTFSHVVRRLFSNGTIVTFAGTGVAGFSGDGGPSTKAAMSLPESSSLHPSSALLVAETGNHVIRCAYLNGTIRTVAGVGGVSGSAGTGDGGPATAGKLNSPHSVAYDSVTQGFWITDSNNNAVRFVSSAGILSTVAGVGGTAGNTGDGGPASLALLSNPIGAVVDGSGGIFITDFANARICRIFIGTVTRTRSTTQSRSRSVTPSRTASTSRSQTPTGSKTITPSLSVSMTSSQSQTPSESTSQSTSSSYSQTVSTSRTASVTETATQSPTQSVTPPQSLSLISTSLSASPTRYPTTTARGMHTGMQTSSIVATTPAMSSSPSVTANRSNLSASFLITTATAASLQPSSPSEPVNITGGVFPPNVSAALGPNGGTGPGTGVISLTIVGAAATIAAATLVIAIILGFCYFKRRVATSTIPTLSVTPVMGTLTANSNKSEGRTNPMRGNLPLRSRDSARSTPDAMAASRNMTFQERQREWFAHPSDKETRVSHEPVPSRSSSQLQQQLSKQKLPVSNSPPPPSSHVATESKPRPVPEAKAQPLSFQERQRMWFAHPSDSVPEKL